MLSELYFPFSLIGLTETKIKVDQSPITNTELPGYSFISQPSYLNAGGVDFYISNNLDFNILSDFTKSTDDFEALWIEVQNIGQPNLLCGIVYRHPNGNLNNFTEYLSATIDKVNCSSKFCTVMGDFNLDLLQVNSPKETDDFLNSLGSSFFLPQIMQPTRIIYHSATLIDNIVFNYLEHFTISVNKRPEEYLRLPQSDSFFISPTTTTEIENIISSLKSGKAVGPFSIPIDILKLLKSVISKPLEILFNTSFSTGTVPTDFKLANIIPVYKKGSRTCLSNYRPISLLSVFNKLLERLMYNRLIKYLDNSNIFYNKQFCF